MLYEAEPVLTLSYTGLGQVARAGLPSECRVSFQQRWVQEVDSISGLGQDSPGKNLGGVLMWRKAYEGPCLQSAW